ncbi:MAG TPA: hypothetical protein VFF28_04990, partial [Candidatus Nanoarchaeia archaeon]|nr:hypothetical protein [Candidatus Nanoarchaeia archaeon]
MAYFETEIEGIQCIVNVMKTENPDRYVQQIASAAHKLHEKTKGIDYARMGELAGMEDSHTSMLRARERFSINNCIITGWPGTIQACLEVTAPDGNKSRITIGENGMRYLGASSSNGFDKGNLPLGALLCAGYFLPAERTA